MISLSFYKLLQSWYELNNLKVSQVIHIISRYKGSPSSADEISGLLGYDVMLKVSIANISEEPSLLPLPRPPPPPTVILNYNVHFLCKRFQHTKPTVIKHFIITIITP
jgi:hypothetical protein